MDSHFTSPSTQRPIFMDYAAVPSLPKGLTRASYESVPSSPLAQNTHSIEHIPVCEVTGVTYSENSSLDKGKGKTREQEIVSGFSPLEATSSSFPSQSGMDINAAGNALLDAFYTQKALPLSNFHMEPPLLKKVFMINTRFYFARWWNKVSQALQQDEIKRLVKHCVYHGDCSRGHSSCASLYNTLHQSKQREWPPWELALSSDLSEEKGSANHLMDGMIVWPSPVQQNPIKFSSGSIRSHVESDQPLLDIPRHSIDVSLGMNESGGFGMDIDPDIGQYFNGIMDPPDKPPPIACQCTFPSCRGCTRFEEYSRTGVRARGPEHFVHDHRSCLHPDEKTGSSRTSATSENGQHQAFELDSPLLMNDQVPAQHSLLNSHDSGPTNPWACGDKKANTSSSLSSGTIDPSLLGGKQAPRPQSSGTKRRNQKSRKFLPEPVIYVRRPQDAHSLQLMRGGKKPVQIKFREHDGSANANGATEIMAAKATLMESEKQEEQAGNNDGRGHSPCCTIISEPQPESATRLEIRASPSIPCVESDSMPSSIPSVGVRLTSSNVRPPDNTCRIYLKGPGGLTTISKGTSPSEKTFCHQCRNTTVRPKMQCSNDVGGGRLCGKRFCERCISKRFVPY